MARFQRAQQLILRLVSSFRQRKDSRRITPYARHRNSFGKVYWKTAQQQDSVPMCSPQELSNKLKINMDERVLVFAGYSGDWANSISKFAKVTYTDLSEESTRIALNRFRGEKRMIAFKIRPASLQPRKSKIYDWSFSFEPFPLHLPSLALQTALLRSLLNKKGAKIVYTGTKLYSTNPNRELELIANLYGVKSELVKTSLVALTKKRAFEGETSGINTMFSVFTLYTNRKARKLATLDLRVLKILNAHAKKRTSLEIQALSKKVGAKEKEVYKSLERLKILFGGTLNMGGKAIEFKYRLI